MRRPARGAALLFLAGATACGGGLDLPYVASTPGGDGALEVVPLETEIERSSRDESSDDEPGDLPELDQRGEQGRLLPDRPTRGPIQPRTFRLSDLPRATIAAPFEAADAPPALPPPAVKSPELSVEHLDEFAEVRLQLGRRSFGRIRIGGPDAPIATGLRVRCGAKRRKVSPMRWELVERLPEARARLSFVDGWFDGATCRASAMRRTTVDPSPVLGHLLFAYLQCGGDCSERATVALVGPALTRVAVAAQGIPMNPRLLAPFGHVGLDVVRGGASSLDARIDPAALELWYGGRPPVWARQELVLGVDVAQSIDEEEPLAIAYIGHLQTR